MAVWVATGGRGTLIGAILGAGVVNAVKTYFTVAYPEAWLLILGGLFVVVTLFLPKGIIGLLDKITHGKKTVKPSVKNMETNQETNQETNIEAKKES